MKQTEHTPHQNPHTWELERAWAKVFGCQFTSGCFSRHARCPWWGQCVNVILKHIIKTKLTILLTWSWQINFYICFMRSLPKKPQRQLCPVAHSSNLWNEIYLLKICFRVNWMWGFTKCYPFLRSLLPLWKIFFSDSGSFPSYPAKGKGSRNCVDFQVEVESVSNHPMESEVFCAFWWKSALVEL